MESLQQLDCELFFWGGFSWKTSDISAASVFSAATSVSFVVVGIWLCSTDCTVQLLRKVYLREHRIPGPWVAQSIPDLPQDIQERST